MLSNPFLSVCSFFIKYTFYVFYIYQKDTKDKS